jgi:hypothetical protein
MFMRRTPPARTARRGASGSVRVHSTGRAGSYWYAVHRPSSRACSSTESSEARRHLHAPAGVRHHARQQRRGRGRVSLPQQLRVVEPGARQCLEHRVERLALAEVQPARITRGRRSGTDSSRSRLASTRSVRRRDIGPPLLAQRHQWPAQVQCPPPATGEHPVAVTAVLRRGRAHGSGSRTRRAAARAPRRRDRDAAHEAGRQELPCPREAAVAQRREHLAICAITG